MPDKVGRIRVGIGGWTYEPWRGVFYPAGLPHARELEYASGVLTSIEINGTFYSRFPAATWRKWRDATPDDFVFAIKASRACTARRVLADSGPAIERFLDQGLTELGRKLGPICWQLPDQKAFDAEDFGAFLELLPKERGGLFLRHAIEARHPSFATPAADALTRRRSVALVHTEGRGAAERETGAGARDFTYARLSVTTERLKQGIGRTQLTALAARARRWAATGDVFVYLIAAAKERNPAAAKALIATLEQLADSRR